MYVGASKKQDELVVPKTNFEASKISGTPESNSKVLFDEHSMRKEELKK